MTDLELLRQATKGLRALGQEKLAFDPLEFGSAAKAIGSAFRVMPHSTYERITDTLPTVAGHALSPVGAAARGALGAAGSAAMAPAIGAGKLLGRAGRGVGREFLGMAKNPKAAVPMALVGGLTVLAPPQLVDSAARVRGNELPYLARGLTPPSAG